MFFTLPRRLDQKVFEDRSKGKSPLKADTAAGQKKLKNNLLHTLSDNDSDSVLHKNPTQDIVSVPFVSLYTKQRNKSKG